MINLSIEGFGGSISIDVLGYERSAANNDSDANWLRSRIRVVAGSFHGEFDAALTTQDFSYFDQELSEVLRVVGGKATFQTDEDCLRFDVVLNHLGGAIISGVVKINDGVQARLDFSFSTDQSYLSKARDSLLDVVKTFPVK